MGTKKNTLLFSIAILLLISSCSKVEYKDFRVYPLKKDIDINSGSSGFIALKVEIPEKKHIYGNPKGPGIAKPTTIKVKYPENIKFDQARYLTPKKHFYPGDKKHVWIYENETFIFVPFSAGKGVYGDFNIKIIFDSLLCDSNTCVPKNITLDCAIHVLKDGTVSSKDDEIGSLYEKSSPPSKLSIKKAHEVKEENLSYCRILSTVL